MSLGKKLLGIFVELDESPTAAPSSPTEKPASPPPLPAASSAQPPAPQGAAPRRPPLSVGNAPLPATPAHDNPVPGSGSAHDGADQALIAQLRKAMQDNNRPGFDYLEFQASLQALAQVIPDEATRFRSAYATAATMGVTVPNLIESAQGYRDMLRQETVEFEKELEAKRKAEVGGRQAELEKLRKEIATASETIEKLTRQIAEAQTRSKTLEKDLADATSRLDRASDRFGSSARALDGEIAQHQNLIRTLLGG